MNAGRARRRDATGAAVASLVLLATSCRAARGDLPPWERHSFRPRPIELADDVVDRGHSDAGLGFPSGHVAVVTAMATVLAPGTSIGARGGMSVVALSVVAGRVYVGAHLPLDAIGGAALGAALGLGVRAACPHARPPG